MADNPYSQYADTIESVLAYICRSKRLPAEQADDFSSVARLHLLENDCAILREFKGLSSFKTFIVAVLKHQFLDWRNAQWGRWRASTEARRLGTVAIELEKVVLRDSIPYEEAVHLLISKGVASSQAECDDIWGRLKRRTPRRLVSSEDANQIGVAADDWVDQEERRQRALIVRQELHTALGELPPGDQLIVKLRMESGFTVARIAKLQGVDQKGLYRRFEQVFKQLRLKMIARGISEDDFQSFFGQFDADDEGFGPVGGNGGIGPSIHPNAGGVA